VKKNPITTDWPTGDEYFKKDIHFVQLHLKKLHRHVFNPTYRSETIKRLCQSILILKYQSTQKKYNDYVFLKKSITIYPLG